MQSNGQGIFVTGDDLLRLTNEFDLQLESLGGSLDKREMVGACLVGAPISALMEWGEKVCSITIDSPQRPNN